MAYGCTSLPWVTKWVFLQDQLSHFPSLGPTWKTPPRKICHTPRRMTWHPLHTVTNLPPTCGEIYLHILDKTMISTDSYHPGSIKAQDMLRRSSPEKIIPAGSAANQPYDCKKLPCKRRHQKTVVPALVAWSGKYVTSSLDRTNMAVLIVEGRTHQFVTTDAR